MCAGLAAATSPAWRLAPAAASPLSRVRPGDLGWPSEGEWARLAAAAGGRLTKPAPPSAAELAANGRNPFFRGEALYLTENAGWLDAWRSAPSAYAVEAESAADVAAAVRFARAHNLRLVVKGGGHSYLGTSCAADSLLIWTRRMNAIALHDAFQPAGSSAPGTPAVSLGAGCLWLHAYQAASAAKRYVQGGGCTSVGVGGLLLGGGFGSFSKRYGLAAASLIEAEIVTADGAVRVVNAAQEPDLFWALKGGGGAFGVVTRFTLATHELPYQFGALNWTVQARSDAAYLRLIAKFVDLYADALFNPHWGETVHFGPNNVVRVTMTFQDLAGADAAAMFKPLADYIAENPADFETQKPLKASAVWASWLWSPWLFRLLARDAVEFDGRPGASWSDFWWKGDAEQVGVFWDAYQSAWLPATLLERGKRGGLVEALFAASRHWTLGLHFNKGLAGAPDAAIAAARDTPVNGELTSAFALAIVAAHSPDPPAQASPQWAAARERAQRVGEAMAALRKAAPGSGSYFNESDYFLDDWARACWGENYPRLSAIKQRYDPSGLFFAHHSVGSEGWSADGFTRIG